MQQFYTENECEIAQENVDQHVCRCVYLYNAGRGRGREEWEACPLQRAVYFVCSTAALAYGAARTVRMINMRGLLVQCLPSSPVPLYVIYDEICQTANTLSTHRHTHTHLSTHMNNLMNVNSTHEFALLAFLFNLSQRQRERERETERVKTAKCVDFQVFL